MSDGIIAYRNPFERWFWESGAAYVFFGTIAVLVVVMLISNWLDDKEGDK